MTAQKSNLAAKFGKHKSSGNIIFQSCLNKSLSALPKKVGAQSESDKNKTNSPQEKTEQVQQWCTGCTWHDMNRCCRVSWHCDGLQHYILVAMRLHLCVLLNEGLDEETRFTQGPRDDHPLPLRQKLNGRKKSPRRSCIAAASASGALAGELLALPRQIPVGGLFV